jgi:hypothetical protein
VLIGNKGQQEDKVLSGSSWRILATLLPMFFILVKVIIYYPKQFFQIFKIARAAKNQTKHPWQRDDTDLPYKIPAYHFGMKSCKSQDKYLRPSRFIESKAPEIIAMANQLGAFQKSDKAYVDQCFTFLQRNILFSIASPLKGARQTMIKGEGICFDKVHLLIALSRAGHIPARIKIMNTAFTQQLFEVFPKEFPIVKDMYDAIGYFLPHAVAEVLVDGEWQVADVSIDDCYRASLGLPITRFGDDPQGKWNWEVPGGTYRYEQIPWLLEFCTKVALKLNQDVLLLIQDSWGDWVKNGRRIMDEMGGEEEYDRKVRQTYKAKLPEVSKRLFKLLSEDEPMEKTAYFQSIPEKGRQDDRRIQSD